MKKLTTLFLSLLLFMGCSSKPVNENSITLWHWMTDRNDAFKQLALQYQQQTGVEVKVELFAPSDAYTQKITASTQAKILPDIYGILDTKETFGKFINYGFVADLTADFKADDGAWESSLFPKAVDSNRFKEDNVYGVKPGIYGVPLDVTNIQMLYNKNLLAKAGYNKPPKTFDEFMEVAQALNRVGVDSMVSGWGEVWMMDCFASNYAFNIMGEDKIMATFRGEVPYTDPDWLKVFQLFEQLRDNKAVATGIVTKPNKEAEQDFALERAAFAFNGSWSVNVYHDMNPDLEYNAMLPPVINPELPMRIWGGAGSSFVVNAASPKKDKAIAFLKWLSGKEQQAFLAKETRNLPSNRKALSSISPLLESFAKSMDNTTHPTVWKYNENPLVIERYTKGLQSILIGRKTAQQVAEEVQEIKQRELDKAKRRQ